jgi:methionine synthase II (cobalamin-independent)
MTLPSDLLAAGTPTGIGGLPYIDPTEAARIELELHPELPAAPQLPRKHPHEAMLAQVAAGMLGIVSEPDGTLRVDRPRALAPVANGAPLDADAWAGTLAFLAECRRRETPIKLQLTGPVTLGIELCSAGVRVTKAFAVAAATVRSRADALVTAARQAAPRAPIVIMLDEPWLAAADEESFPLVPDDTIDLVSGALASAAAAGAAVTGVHCCGDADWSLVLHAGPDIVSLPASADIAQDAPALGVFLDRGGWIAWGVVPTDRPLGIRHEPYWRVLNEAWTDLARGGCDPIAIRTQSLLTPTCGLSLHHPEQVPAVMSLVRAVAQRVQDQALAVRMSAGA